MSAGVSREGRQPSGSDFSGSTCLLSPFPTLVPASPSVLWVMLAQDLVTLDTATVPPEACCRHQGPPHHGGYTRMLEFPLLVTQPLATRAGYYIPDLGEEDSAGSQGLSCNSSASPWTGLFTVLGLSFLIGLFWPNRVMVKITGENEKHSPPCLACPRGR